MAADASAASTETISVYARIRMNEEGNNEVNLVDGAPDKVRARNLEFNLNRAFSTDAAQEDVYNAVAAPLVQRVLDGYNACILAYGQTGSGKTYTMLGPENIKLDGSKGEQAGLGLVPRACLQLFKMLPATYSVTTSYIEIYNDQVKDLLKEPPPSERDYLTLSEVSPGHIEPTGMTRVPVTDTKEVMKMVAKGDSRRVIAAMAMNPRSSRGHGLIGIDVFNADGLPYGRLVMVDLAGMESSKKSSAVEGPSNTPIRKEEAKRINMSLLALSSVVSALAGKGAMRVPFRDSKLTRLLQSSLAGNCKASFVVTVRGEKKNVEEAINTLKFAQRASSVSATVIKNEDARQAKGRGPNKALEAELASAKLALAEFHKTMAGEAKVKDSLMAQVQTLLHEMQQLQRDGEDAKRQARRDSQAGPNPAKHANMERYVKELEARNAVLEEENRLLRQRDIMYRLNATAAATGDAGSDAKINFKTDNLATFNPMATAGFASQLDADLHPLKRQSTREFAKGHAPGQVLVRRNSNSFTKHQSSTAKSRWGTLRVAFRLAKKRSAKVHPKAYVDPTPKGRAATYIQKIARGYIVRKELSYWDDTYFDDIYGYDYDYD